MRIGCPLYLWKTLKPFEIKGLGKKISPRQFYQNYRGDMVRVARLERAASTSQMWRPTNWATPGYFAVVIIARKSCDAKIFLSVVNPVVKAVFLPGLQTGSNPANDRVARGSGPPFLRSWMVLTALPKQARYQLRYTRVIGISPAGRIAAPGALMRRTGQHAYYIGHDEKKQGESMLCAQHKICWRRWTCRKKNAAGKTHARAG